MAAAAGAAGIFILKSAAVAAFSHYVVTPLFQKIGILPDYQDLLEGGMDIGQAGIMVNKMSNVAPINVIYGIRKVGGTVVYVASDNSGFYKMLHVALVLGEGEIEGITTVVDSPHLDIWLNDIHHQDSRLNVPGWGNPAMYLLKGSDWQENPGFAAPGWTSSHRLRGTAFIMAKIPWKPGVYSGMPVITASVKGRTVYNADSGITEWTDNPAWCIRDYLTNTRYGCGIPESRIEDSAFIDAADYCDETVDYYDREGAHVYHNRYICNGVVNVDNLPLQNVRQMLTCCRGILNFTGGMYRLRIDKPETGTLTIQEREVLGGFTFGYAPKGQKINRCRVRFFNPDKNWQPDIVPVDSEELRKEDNYALLEKQIELPFTTHEAIAREIATIEINISRQAIRTAFTTVPTALKAEAGDVITLRHNVPGWAAGKAFKLEGLGIKGGEVVVSGSEYSPTSYTVSDVVLGDDAPDTNLPDPMTVEPPGAPVVQESLYTTREGAGLKVKASLSWEESPDAFVDQYEIQKQQGIAVTFVGVTSDNAMEIFDIEPGTYAFYVRAVNVFGAKSSWAIGGVVTIEGLAAIPADVTGLSINANLLQVILSWDAATDLDVLHGGHFRIRHTSEVSSPSWGQGHEIMANVAGTATQAIMPMGIHDAMGTFMIKAVDILGQESENAATVTVGNNPDPFSYTLIHTKNLNDLDAKAPDDWDDGSATLTYCEDLGPSGTLRITQGTSPDRVLYIWPDDLATWIMKPATYFDLGGAFPAVAKITLEILADVSQVQNLIDGRTGNIDTWPSIDTGASESLAPAWCEIFIRYADTTVLLATAEWSRVQQSCFIYGRYYHFKIVLKTTDAGWNIYLSNIIAKAYTVDNI